MSLTDRQIEAYSRQLILQEYSGAAQERLLAARIEITGHGLAAQTAASYLAGAGVASLYELTSTQGRSWSEVWPPGRKVALQPNLSFNRLLLTTQG